VTLLVVHTLFSIELLTFQRRLTNTRAAPAAERRDEPSDHDAGAHTSSLVARRGTADWWRLRQTETAVMENARVEREGRLARRGAKRVTVRFERDRKIQFKVFQPPGLETVRATAPEPMPQGLVVLVVVVVVFFG
jgi:hypothetical protein